MSRGYGVEGMQVFCEGSGWMPRVAKAGLAAQKETLLTVRGRAQHWQSGRVVSMVAEEGG